MPIIKSVIDVIYCIGFSNLYIELTLLQGPLHTIYPLIMLEFP